MNQVFCTIVRPGDQKEPPVWPGKLTDFFFGSFLTIDQKQHRRYHQAEAGGRSWLIKALLDGLEQTAEFIVKWHLDTNLI